MDAIQLCVMEKFHDELRWPAWATLRRFLGPQIWRKLTCRTRGRTHARVCWVPGWLIFVVDRMTIETVDKMRWEHRNVVRVAVRYVGSRPHLLTVIEAAHRLGGYGAVWNLLIEVVNK